MFGNPSLITRITIGKTIGFIVGLLGFFILPYFMPDAHWTVRWGVLFWYTTIGAIIGILGVFTRHPVLQLPMPWWIRAPFLGGWMNFVLTLFIYEQIEGAMIKFMGGPGMLSSPFWLVLEGAIVGLIIGFFATTFGGEGKKTVEEI